MTEFATIERLLDQSSRQVLALDAHLCLRCGARFTELTNIGRWSCYQYVGLLGPDQPCYVRADHIADELIFDQIMEEERQYEFHHKKPITGVTTYTTNHDIKKTAPEFNHLWITREERRMPGQLNKQYYKRLCQITGVPIDPSVMSRRMNNLIIRRFDSEMQILFNILQAQGNEHLLKRRMIYGWSDRRYRYAYVLDGPRFIQEGREIPTPIDYTPPDAY